MPFTYAAGTATARDALSIQESITTAFVKTKRFVVVDRSKMDALQREKDLQKSEDFLDGRVIQQGVSLGADYLISGHVASAQAYEMKAQDANGKITTTYMAKLSFLLNVIDVATGEVIVSETIEPKAGSSWLGVLGIGASTPEDAVTQALKNIGDKIDDFVARYFAQTFSIAQILEKNSKGGATKLLIAGGSASGLKKGDKLTVYELSEIELEGKRLARRRELGEIKIIEVENENFSVCAVNTGGAEIHARFLENARIQIVTTD